VISPLRALIGDQIGRCAQMGVKAVALGNLHEMSDEDHAGDCFVKSLLLNVNELKPK